MASAVSSIDLAEMQEHAREASALLKAMASPHRLMVLCNLMGGERCVGDLLHSLPLSTSALSQHLAVLRREGLVQTRRSAQTIYYRLAPGPTAAIISSLYARFCAPSSAARERRAGSGAQ